MDHERARALISERMDGEALPNRVIVPLDRHVKTCPSCAAFAEGAQRLRAAARFRVAAAVPDLVDPIMAAVATERRAGLARPGPIRALRPVHGPGKTRRPLLGRPAPAVAPP